jgi:hypothetical protein
MRFGALALVGLALAGAAAAASTRPTLALPDRAPLRVVGVHFKPRELVTVIVVQGARHERRVRATANGRFSVRFRLSLQECAKWAVSARGNGGSRAYYKRPQTMCPNPPAAP